MSQVQISTDTALREAMIESEWRKNRIVVLAQQLADAHRRIAELETATKPIEPPPES